MEEEGRLDDEEPLDERMSMNDLNERESMDEKEGVLSAEELVHMLDKGKARLEAEGMGGVELRKVLEWTGAPWEKEEVCTFYLVNILPLREAAKKVIFLVDRPQRGLGGG